MRAHRWIRALAAFAIGSAPWNASAQAIAPGDLLLACPYWGITRIVPATGEQKPLGVGTSGQAAALAVAEDGTVWVVVPALLRVDPDTGEQSVYSSQLGTVAAADLTSQGDVILSNSGGLMLLADPETPPVLLLATGPGLPVLEARNLAVTAQDQVVIASFRNEGAGVSFGALFLLDPAAPSLRVLSQRPPAGGLATAADGSLFLATSVGPVDLRSVNPRTGRTQPVAGEGLLTAPADAAVEGDGAVLVLNGGFNAPSVVRVDPTSGAQTPLASGDRLASPQAIAVSGDGTIFVADVPAGELIAVDPGTGAQTAASSQPVGAMDLQPEASGTVLTLPQSGGSLLRVDPESGSHEPVGPSLQSPTAAVGASSSIALGLDGTPFVTLVTGPGNDVDLFRAPLDAAEPVFVSELAICAGSELETVRAVPEPGAGVGAAVALATLFLLRRRRSTPR